MEDGSNRENKSMLHYNTWEGVKPLWRKHITNNHFETGLKRKQEEVKTATEHTFVNLLSSKQTCTRQLSILYC